MADSVIINEQERTGILPYEEMMAKATAMVATPMPNAGSGVDLSGFEPSGNAPAASATGSSNSDATPGMSLLEDVLSTFYSNPSSAQGKNATTKPGVSGPFMTSRKTIAPFTVMSPQIDIRDFIAPKGVKPGYHNLTAQQWVSGKSGGKKAAKAQKGNGGAISMFTAYKGGLDDIRGASMPGMRVTPTGDIRVTMGMLDPKLVMALQKERERQLESNVAPDAKALTNEDFRQLTKFNNPNVRKQLGI